MTINVTTKHGGIVYDPFDGDITRMGELMDILPISHQCTRLIMLGYVFGVMEECIIIGMTRYK